MLEERGGRKLGLRKRDSGLFLIGGTLLSSKLVIREGEGGNWNFPCVWQWSTMCDGWSPSWENSRLLKEFEKEGSERVDRLSGSSDFVLITITTRNTQST